MLAFSLYNTKYGEEFEGSGAFFHDSWIDMHASCTLLEDPLFQFRMLAVGKTIISWVATRDTQLAGGP